MTSTKVFCFLFLTVLILSSLCYVEADDSLHRRLSNKNKAAAKAKPAPAPAQPSIPFPVSGSISGSASTSGSLHVTVTGSSSTQNQGTYSGYVGVTQNMIPVTTTTQIKKSDSSDSSKNKSDSSDSSKKKSDSSDSSEKKPVAWNPTQITENNVCLSTQIAITLDTLVNNKYVTACVSCADVLPGCQMCTGTSKLNAVCKTCSKGMALGSDGKCAPCAEGCSLCTKPGSMDFCSEKIMVSVKVYGDPACLRTTDTGACASCQLGYGLSAEGTCKKCLQEGCDLCYWKNVTNSFGTALTEMCSIASSGYEVIEGFSRIVEEKPECDIENCNECFYGLNNTKTCNRCSEGYGLLVNGTCTQCISGCQMCTTMITSWGNTNTYGRKLSKKSAKKPKYNVQQSTTITYNVNVNVQVQATPAPLISMYTNANTKMQCLMCNKGYTMIFDEETKESACISCPANCAKCSGNEMCSSCQWGYYLTQDQKCATCDSLVPGCTSCSYSTTKEEVICSRCPDGTYYDSIARKCSACDTSCLTCTGPSSTQCSGCSVNKKLSSALDVNGYTIGKLCVDISECAAPTGRRQLSGKKKAKAQKKISNSGKSDKNSESSYKPNITEIVYVCIKEIYVVDPNKTISNNIAAIQQSLDNEWDKAVANCTDEKKVNCSCHGVLVENYDAEDTQKLFAKRSCVCDFGYKGYYCDYDVGTYENLQQTTTTITQNIVDMSASGEISVVETVEAISELTSLPVSNDNVIDLINVIEEVVPVVDNLQDLSSVLQATTDLITSETDDQTLSGTFEVTANGDIIDVTASVEITTNTTETPAETTTNTTETTTNTTEIIKNTTETPAETTETPAEITETFGLGDTTETTDIIVEQGNAVLEQIATTASTLLSQENPDATTVQSVELSNTEGSVTITVFNIPSKDEIQCENPDANTTEEPATNSTSEVPATNSTSEVPATNSTTEEPATDVATEEPTIDVTTEEPTIDVTTEEPTIDVTTEEPTIDVTTEEPTIDVTTEEPTIDVTTEEPTIDVTTEEPATNSTSEEPATNVTSEVPATNSTIEEYTGPSSDVTEAGDVVVKTEYTEITLSPDSGSLSIFSIDTEINPVDEIINIMRRRNRVLAEQLTYVTGSVMISIARQGGQEAILETPMNFTLDGVLSYCSVGCTHKCLYYDSEKYTWTEKANLTYIGHDSKSNTYKCSSLFGGRFIVAQYGTPPGPSSQDKSIEMQLYSSVILFSVSLLSLLLAFL